MLSLRRRRSSRTAGQAVPASVAPGRPQGEWASLPPVRSASARSVAIVQHADFRASLATTWSAPPALQPLGHHVSPAAPVGLIAAHVAPLQAYDAASLRFPPAIPVDAEPATPVAWTLPRPAEKRRVGHSEVLAVPSSRPRLLDRLPGRRRTQPRVADATEVAAGTREVVHGPEDLGRNRLRPVTSSDRVGPGSTTRPSAPVAVMGQVPRPASPIPGVELGRRAPRPDSGAATAPSGSRDARAAAALGPREAPTGRSTRIAHGPASPKRVTRPVVSTPVAERSGPAAQPDGGTPAGPLRFPVARDGGIDDAQPVEPTHPVPGGHVAPEVEQGGPAGASEAGTPAGSLRSSAAAGSTADETDDDRWSVPDGSRSDEEEPAGRLYAAAVPTAVVPTLPPVLQPPATEVVRTLVSRRSLGADLLGSARATATPRPTAGFAPAVLPDPVARRDAVDRRGAALARPALPDLGGSDPRPPAGPNDGDPTTDAPDDHGPELPDRAANPGARTPQPGLPDWWPAESATWSVRDVDPFQVEEPRPATDDGAAPRGPLAPPRDAVGPPLRQRIRPTRGPAPGAPVSRRVAFPGPAGDELPALRQVRRPAEPARHPLLDPHLPAPVAAAAEEHGARALPAVPPEPADAPAQAPPAAAAAPLPAALSEQDVADHVRHALLVERERSGALADQW